MHIEDTKAGDTMPSCHSTRDLPSAPGRKRILVADDNPVNREVAIAMLASFDVECSQASDGREAIALHNARPFDMILMDCEMPGMDGLEATKRIRTAERASRTPIVALTAASADEERDRCLEAGMDGFLAKPIRRQPLGEMLARWFPASAVPAPVAAPLACEDELEAIRDMFGVAFGELAALYQRDTPRRLDGLRLSLANGDFPLLAKIAHALGGSSASIGATGLCFLCKKLETAAKAGALDTLAPEMAAIEMEYQRISSKLQLLLR